MCRLYTLSPDVSFSMTVMLKSKNVLWLKTSVCFSGKTRFEHRCINFDRTLELNCSTASMRLKSDKQTGRFSVLESQIPSENSSLQWSDCSWCWRKQFTLAWRSLWVILQFQFLTNVSDVTLRRTTDLYLCQPSTENNNWANNKDAHKSALWSSSSQVLPSCLSAALVRRKAGNVASHIRQLLMSL